MFVAGKLLWLVFQPLSLVFFLIAAAVALQLLRWRKLAVLLSSMAGLILFIALFTTFGAWSLQHLEARYPKPALPENVACMVVLGGAFDLEVTAGRGGMEMNQSADRFIEAARLARLHPDAKILVSGGDGSFSGDYKGDAELAGDFFSAMGVDPGRIIRETVSRNTAENVSQTKQLLDSNGLADCLLITSAYHMPRARALFEARNVATIAWPTDYRASGKVALGLDFTQPTLNSQLISTATREWLALLNSYATGKTRQLVP
ncbi:YdcF family protein [Rhizobium sp. KVB221]|uniref:YdcF family protein n=1 Tax=Rhizobium setariae TaxID=2801340 RepID=A0A936YLQ1_9HYPH|nr:YdcF family protein [Rhizobium setariae]MBL0370474.1 YdcF family protein [Rhizobium setariae]